MLLVIADTSPVRYLIQIWQMPHSSAPPAVQAWIRKLPEWVEIHSSPERDEPELNSLDAGERSAISLGLFLKADLILIDERKAARVARNQGFEVIGTLGILDLAAERLMIDLRAALDQLRSTNFRFRSDLFARLLKKHGLADD